MNKLCEYFTHSNHSKLESNLTPASINYIMKYKSLLIAAALPLGLTAATFNFTPGGNGGVDSIWDTSNQNWDSTSAAWTSATAHFAELGSNNVTLGASVKMTGFNGSGAIGGNSSVLDLRIGGAGETSTFSGALGTNVKLVWDGTSVLDLSGTNNSTRQSVLRSGGTLRLSNADAWQAGTKAKIEAGSGSFTIELAAADEDFNGNLFLNSTTQTARFAAVDAERNMTYDSDNVNFVWGGSGGKMGVLGLGSANSTHTLTWTNNINLNGANRTVDVLNGSAAIGGNISGVISDSVGGFGLTKTGTGTLKLSAANTYTGMTTVAEGELILDGSLAGGVTVDAGAILSGSGAIDGASTINGMLNPGNSPGTLTFNDALNLGATSETTFEIVDLANFDVLANDGGDTITFADGATIVFDTTGYTANLGDSFLVLNNWAGYGGTLGNLTITGTDLGGGLSLDTSALLTDGTVTVIPEPATIGMLAPWWDNWPRHAVAETVEEAEAANASFVQNGSVSDPGWGTWFQDSGVASDRPKIQALQAAGIKQVTYAETFGDSYNFISLVGEKTDENPAPILRSYWGWSGYTPEETGTIMWQGAWTFFDAPVQAEPFTLNHPRYGGDPLLYPDGTVATGLVNTAGSEYDPRNKRVYDAGSSKNIDGEVMFGGYKVNPNSSTNGTFLYNGDWVAMANTRKDSACPGWTSYTYASILRMADEGVNGIWSDNYGPWDSFGSDPWKNAFGDWSVARFRTHLQENFSAAEQLAMGVIDVNTFDVRIYLKDKGWAWGDVRWVDDPVWRAYLIAKRRFGTEGLSDYYHTVKAAAAAAGNDEFLVMGNDIPAFSLGWPRGDLDMVATELSSGWSLCAGSSGFTLPPVGRYGGFYKTAREHAQSRFVNVWLYNNQYETEYENQSLCKVMYYEMLANYTFHKFHASHDRMTGTPETAREFNGFVESAAPVFGDRIPCQRIGLYYSSSSVLRQMTMQNRLNFNDQPHHFELWGWGTALDQLHQQYRVIPEWKLTAATLSNLDLLIVPNAGVFGSNAVQNILQPWLDAGGKVIFSGADNGKYGDEDDNFDELAQPSVTPVLAHTNVTTCSAIGKDYFKAYASRSDTQLAAFETVLDTALTDVPAYGVVSTTASKNHGITLHEDAAKNRFFIDVNNVDISQTTFAVTETGTLQIEAVLPAYLRGEELAVFVLSPQQGTPVSVKQLVPSDPDNLKVELSSVEYYASVVVQLAHRWANPAAGGDWNTAANWDPAFVPNTNTIPQWDYASDGLKISITTPAACAGFTARRSDDTTPYANETGGLEILNYGSVDGSLSIAEGLGTLDMTENPSVGVHLYVENESTHTASTVLDAGTVRVRSLTLGNSHSTSHSSFLTAPDYLQVQLELQLGESGAGGSAEFTQNSGTVVVNDAASGVQLGHAGVAGNYILNGGTCSFASLVFGGTDSVFEFNDGTFSSDLDGAERNADLLWYAEDATGRVELGDGTPEFNIAAGRTLTVSNNVMVVDKVQQRGSLLKTGGGTLVLQSGINVSGTVDVRGGVLSLGDVPGNVLMALVLTNGALVDLNFAGTATVARISFDGGQTFVMDGTVDSSDAHFTGSGSLRILGLGENAYFWDGSGDGTTWDTTSQNWSPAGAAWTSPAHFAELGSNNVTLGAAVRMTGFNGSGTIDAGSVLDLRMGGAGVTSTFSGTLGADVKLVWDGTSVLDLSGANNSTRQAVMRNNGTLRLSRADAWQAGTQAKIELNGSASNNEFTIELAAEDENFSSSKLSLMSTAADTTARFAAVGAERNMSHGDGNGNFVWGGGAQKIGVIGLGSANSTHTLNWTNKINLNGVNRTVDVLNGFAAIGGNISGVISDSVGVGGAELTKTGTGTLKLSAANTYTGDTTITAGAFELASTGSMSFLIGEDGVNNQIVDTVATAITLDGLFVFDLTGASDEFGDSWTIVMSNLEAYGTNFDVTGFTEGATGIWTSGIYQFSESTGALSVVPEPGTYALLAGCFALASVMIRRRR